MSQNEIKNVESLEFDMSMFDTPDGDADAENLVLTPEEISKYETGDAHVALNNDDLTDFSKGFPDFVITVNKEVQTILDVKTAEKKAAKASNARKTPKKRAFGRCPVFPHSLPKRGARFRILLPLPIRV